MEGDGDRGGGVSYWRFFTSTRTAQRPTEAPPNQSRPGISYCVLEITSFTSPPPTWAVLASGRDAAARSKAVPFKETQYLQWIYDNTLSSCMVMVPNEFGHSEPCPRQVRVEESCALEYAIKVL